MKDTANGLAQQIAEWLRVLLEHSQVVELRALNVPQDYGKPAPMFGYFENDHLLEMAQAAVQLSNDGASGVYFTLNPVNPDLLARAANRVRVAKSGETTTDADIVRRRWLLVDCDPTRPAGISATNEEKEFARQVAVDVDAFLFDAGWPAPIRSDSGNGHHLKYRIDLPTDDGELIKRCLLALAHKFDNEHVSIDTVVFNPARICKLPGSMSRKGDDIPARPHRQSAILQIPDELTPVPLELLERLAALAPESSTRPTPKVNGQAPASGSRDQLIPFDVEAWLTKRNVEILERDTNDGVRRWFVTCPGIASHTTTNGTKDCVITQESSGRLGGQCFHSSCGMRSWQDISEAIGKPTRDDYPPEDAANQPVARGELHSAMNSNSSPERSNGQAQSSASIVPPFSLDLITSEQFNATSYRRHFLIKRLLVEGQPCVLGGPKKALKTSLLVDLAWSLGTGTPFLGHEQFMVPDPVNVMLLSGESGGYTLQETARRIALARGRVLSSARVFWGFKLPQLGNLTHLDELAKQIRAHDIKVAIIDPAFLCLLAAGESSNITSNVFAMGPLLSAVSEIMRETGCTLIIAHHTGKAVERSRPFGVPELDDLSGSGFAEWARQWVLVNRREAYQAGEHRLWCNVGGSAGHSGTWAIDVSEGTIEEDGDIRKWDVSVTTATEAMQLARDTKAQNHEREKQETAERNAARIRDVLSKSSEPLTANALRTKLGMNADTVAMAIETLTDELIEESVKAGNGQFYIGYRLKNESPGHSDKNAGQRCPSASWNAGQDTPSL